MAAGHLAVGTEDTITELRVSVRAVLLDTGGRVLLIEAGETACRFPGSVANWPRSTCGFPAGGAWRRGGVFPAIVVISYRPETEAGL